MNIQRIPAIIAGIVLGIYLLSLVGPLFYGGAHLHEFGGISSHFSSLGMATLNTAAFAMVSGLLQTILGVLSAIFVTAYLTGRSRRSQIPALVIDCVLLSPYLVPTACWFWIFAELQITSYGCLLRILPVPPSHVAAIAELLDLHLITLLHLTPFTYLAGRLFFSRLDCEKLRFVEWKIGSRTKAYLLLGGRPMVILISMLFALRVLLTGNKYDLPFFGSKAYDGIRSESLAYTIPLWLEQLAGSGTERFLGNSAALSFALVFLLLMSLLAYSGVRFVRRAPSERTKKLPGRLPAFVLFALKRSPRRLLGATSVAAFIVLAGAPAFLGSVLLPTVSINSLRALMDTTAFLPSLRLTFTLILALTLVGAFIVPLCRIAHLLCRGWGRPVQAHAVAILLLLPPVLLALAWRPLPFPPRMAVYVIFLFVTLFPLLLMQATAALPATAADSVAAEMRSRSSFLFVLRHLRAGHLQTFSIAAYLLAYVVVVNEIAGAQFILPPGNRPLNYTLFNLRNVFDYNFAVLATAPVMIVALALLIFLPLYLFSCGAFARRT